MEISVYNIKGEDTGKKVTLKDGVFGIEPNDHVIYLDVNNIWQTNVKERQKPKKEVKCREAPAN